MEIFRSAKKDFRISIFQILKMGPFNHENDLVFSKNAHMNLNKVKNQKEKQVTKYY